MYFYPHCLVLHGAYNKHVGIDDHKPSHIFINVNDFIRYVVPSVGVSYSHLQAYSRRMTVNLMSNRGFYLSVKISSLTTAHFSGFQVMYTQLYYHRYNICKIHHK